MQKLRLMVSIWKVLVFLNFVYNPIGAACTGSTPNTLYNLMHNFFVSQHAVFLFRHQKVWNITFNMTPNMPWYVKYFGVKRNYFMILRKLCNSSTSLMEIFMICGHLQDISICWVWTVNRKNLYWELDTTRSTPTQFEIGKFKNINQYTRRGSKIIWVNKNVITL